MGIFKLMDWSRLSVGGVADLTPGSTVGAVRSAGIAECCALAQDGSSESWGTDERKSIQKRHKNGKRNNEE
jgi:hypothetical protein